MPTAYAQAATGMAISSSRFVSRTRRTVGGVQRQSRNAVLNCQAVRPGPRWGEGGGFVQVQPYEQGRSITVARRAPELVQKFGGMALTTILSRLMMM